MARLVVNSDDFSNRLRKFEMKCRSCNSGNVTLDIDWASYPSASWFNITIICDDCHHDEKIYETD